MKEEAVAARTSESPAEWGYPYTALMALAELPGLQIGALTPLGRIPRPSAPADRAALIALLEAQPAGGRLAMQSLIDPRMTVALFLGDGDTSLLGQYVWPDADGRGPCFKVVVDESDVRLSGPLVMDDVVQGIFDLFSLSGIAESEPLVFSLQAEQFWAMLALVDAYRMTALQRRLVRAGGLPQGIAQATLQQAWTLGLGIKDPGWGVSLFAMLLPDQVPPRFEASLTAVVQALAQDGLLYVLEAEQGDADGDWYVPGEALEAFCCGVARNPLYLGLTLQRVIGQGQVGTTVIGSWRTLSGIWTADVSDIARGRVELRCDGPAFFSRFLETLLYPQGPADGDLAPNPLYAPETLLAALKTTSVAGQTAIQAALCPACGKAVEAGARRCAACGASWGERYCTACNKPLPATAKFCRYCGSRQEVQSGSSAGQEP